MQKNAITRRRALIGLSGSATAVLADAGAAGAATPSEIAAGLAPRERSAASCRRLSKARIISTPLSSAPTSPKAGPAFRCGLSSRSSTAPRACRLAARESMSGIATPPGIIRATRGRATGRDVSTNGEKFLRGTQMTDAAGSVSFRTIYPGWYRGRTAHIHFKVFLDTKTVLTGQLYFPDALSEFIYTSVPPYTSARTSAIR